MLRRKLYDYDFMGGIVAVYLGNSSNVEEALIKYFDSKESRGIWGFYGNDLSELKKKIDSPLADLIYYIRSGSTKKELLDKISELSNEEILAFNYFYDSNSFMDSLKKSGFNPITGLISGAYYGIEQVLVSKVMVNISKENRIRVGDFKEICLNSYKVNEALNYYPLDKEPDGYTIHLLDINDEFMTSNLEEKPYLGQLITFGKIINAYIYDKELSFEALDKIGVRLKCLIKNLHIKEINIINQFYYKEIDFMVKKYLNDVIINCYIPLSNMERKACKLMYQYHLNQIDKSGAPYYMHPFFVGIHCNNTKSRIVGFLHDTLEDTTITLDEIKQFGDEITEALLLLTHNDDTPYLDYVKKAATNKIAKEVKLADLLHNTNLGRQLHPNDNIFERLVRKYDQAINYLKNK